MAVLDMCGWPTFHRYTSGSILSIVAGVIAMGVALLGVIGGCLLWRWALALVSMCGHVHVTEITILCSPLPLQYAIIVALFVALEIASAITGFVFRNEVVGTL